MSIFPCGEQDAKRLSGWLYWWFKTRPSVSGIIHEKTCIPFDLRLKGNMRVWNKNHVPVKLPFHATRLRKRQSHILKGTWYLGADPSKETTPIKIAMMRLKTGEMLIVVTSRIRIKTALSTYRNRWGIETLFSALKTRGLGLNAFRKAMVRMSEIEIHDYIVAFFKTSIPRKALIGLVLWKESGTVSNDRT